MGVLCQGIVAIDGFALWIGVLCQRIVAIAGVLCQGIIAIDGCGVSRNRRYRWVCCVKESSL